MNISTVSEDPPRCLGKGLRIAFDRDPPPRCAQIELLPRRLIRRAIICLGIRQCRCAFWPTLSMHPLLTCKGLSWNSFARSHFGGWPRSVSSSSGAGGCRFKTRGAIIATDMALVRLHPIGAVPAIASRPPSSGSPRAGSCVPGASAQVLMVLMMDRMKNGPQRPVFTRGARQDHRR